MHRRESALQSKELEYLQADTRPEDALDRRPGTEPGQEAETQRAHDRKLQAMGQLAGGVAHDFNNLLTAIIGAADGVLERPGIDAETAADMRQIRLAGERGAALVRQLLMFGRRRTLEPGAVAVNAAIGSLAPLLQRLVGEKIHLDLRLEEPDQWVRADPTQLDQVLMNLAVNARDAMQPDRRAGGVLTLRTAHRLLQRPEAHGTEIIPPGRYVLIEVVDTGGGIPPDALPHVFEPFFTTRGKTGGSGLGLSTVLGIVRRSAGFVTVDSKVGEGTTICLYLPWHDGSGPAETASADIAASGATLFHPGSAPATGIARR
ncbi:MAG TPA: ATP-binding protein, partial [Acetobacteraceae bacterium]